jgi:phospholipase/carboxylesterase
MPHTNLYWRTFRPAEGFYTSEVEAPPRRLPVRTFMPKGYEPNYAYPLLVLFHGHAGSDEQVLRLAPRLSRRNYICIALRGPRAMTDRRGRLRYSWDGDVPCDALVEDYVLQAVEQTRRNYHVHSERIYLAGLCDGATLAYRLALTFSERFAGVIALNGAMPRKGGPLLRLPEARRLRVFIGHGIANGRIPLAAARRDFHVLYAAGISVGLHPYATTHRLHPHMLRDVNRWIIQGISAEDGADE